MREADAIEELWENQARSRRLANLRRGRIRTDDRHRKAPIVGIPTIGGFLRIPMNQDEECRDEQGDRGRTDARIARRLGLGGKDLYRQARAIWRVAQSGDARAQSGVAQLDAGTKTIYAAYKDLRRRNRFSADFRPTPYDVWSFRHDRAFGVAHAGRFRRRSSPIRFTTTL